MYPLNPGDCFVNKETASHRRHCRVVISDPNKNDKVVAIANFTSWTDSREDDSCLIRAGEHTFVKHLSCVNYREACKSSVAAIEKGVADGVLMPASPTSVQLLRRIRIGARDSKFAMGWLISLLEEQGLFD